MTKAKTTETLLRGEDYSFSHSEAKNGIERDIYISGDLVELNLEYDLDGNPTGVTVTAMGYGVSEISVYGEDGLKLTDEQIEILTYELLDDQPRLIGRMTGFAADVSEEGPAYA